MTGLSVPFPARPALLMLSHCMPSPGASSEHRRRAWQLLELFGKTHSIYLACLADGAVSLRDWQRVQQHVKQVALEPRPWLRRWTGRVLDAVAPGSGARLALGATFARPVAEWSTRVEFATVVCTEPGMQPTAGRIEAGERLVEVRDRAAISAARRGGASMAIVATPTLARLAQAAGLAPMLVTAAADERAGLLFPTQEETGAMVIGLKKAA